MTGLLTHRKHTCTRGIRPAETAVAKTTLAVINAATGARFMLAFVLALFYINKDLVKNCK